MHTLLPHLCLLCLQRCNAQDIICSDCVASLPKPEHTCMQCGQALTVSAEACCQCLKKPPQSDETIAGFSYAGAIAKLVIGFKFHHQFHAGRFLAQHLADCIQTAYATRQQPQVLIPIPLHWSRQLQRGYNQSIWIARRLSQALDIPIDNHCCRRQKATRRQSDLTYAARKKNVAQAFEIKPITYHHVAVIDDVVTTGHTVNALATLLKRQGVEHVAVWCLARA